VECGAAECAAIDAALAFLDAVDDDFGFELHDASFVVGV
jgi:hypothetical protein